MKKNIFVLFVFFLIPIMSGCNKEEVKTNINTAINVVENNINEVKESEIIKNVKDYVEKKKMDINDEVISNIQNYISEKY